VEYRHIYLRNPNEALALLDQSSIQAFIGIGFAFGLIVGAVMTRWITEKEAERSRQQRQGFWTPKRIVGAIGIAVLTIYFIISLLV